MSKKGSALDFYHQLVQPSPGVAMTLLQRFLRLFKRAELPPDYRWHRVGIMKPDGRPENLPVTVKLLGSDFFKVFVIRPKRGRYRLPVAGEATGDCVSLRSEHGYFLLRNSTSLREQSQIRLLPGGDLVICCEDLPAGPIYFSIESESVEELVEGQYVPDISSDVCIGDFRQRPVGNFIFHLLLPSQYGCKDVSYCRWGCIKAGESLHWQIHGETATHRILAPSNIEPGQKVTLIVRSLPDPSLPPVNRFFMIANMLDKSGSANRFEQSFEEYVYHQYPVPTDRILRFRADRSCRHLLIAAGNQLLTPMIPLNII